MKTNQFSKPLILFLSMTLLISGCSFGTDEKPIELSLPKPTGSYNIGMTKLHLTDGTRSDPWVKDQNRELMISIWYPAKKGYKGKRAPYMDQHIADMFSKEMVSTLQINANKINLAHLKTNAWLNAPITTNRESYPVILYSPGSGLPRTMSTFIVEELASRGYVIVTIDHTYEAAVEFPENRLEKVSMPKFSKKTFKKLLQVREKDIRFVLDQLTLLQKDQLSEAKQQKLPVGISKLLDLTKIGMFGHSAGGYTTANVMSHDPRISAGINMDGSLGYEEKSGQVSFPAAPKGIKQPFLLLTANNTHLVAPSVKLMWPKLTGWKLDLNVSKGEHFTFTDYLVFLPDLEKQFELSDQIIKKSIGTTQNSDRVIQSLRAYITAFFDEHLKQKPQKLLDGSSPNHPDIKFVY